MAADDGSEASGVTLLRSALAAFNNGDLDACAEFLAPEFIANIPGLPEPAIGREAWKQNAQMLLDAFPDMKMDIQDVFGSGDRAALRLTFRGTHKNAFLGIPATGREVAFSSVELYRVEGDLLAEEWVAPDIASLMGQITAP
jgi:steroid delta-isomerase-like uncharacterized protein